MIRRFIKIDWSGLWTAHWFDMYVVNKITRRIYEPVLLEQIARTPLLLQNEARVGAYAEFTIRRHGPRLLDLDEH